MTDLEDKAAEIARGLTKNQQRLCLLIAEYGEADIEPTAALMHTNVTALAPLINAGVATLAHDDDWRAFYSLTPLGLAVANHLKASSDDR